VARLAAQRPAHLYEGLLTVLLRLVFLLYAEDRALIPSRTDGQARALYELGYGVRTLHAQLLADQARNPDTMDERRGAWSRLLALFRLVHAGDGSGWIRRRGGKLFDPNGFPFLQGQDDAPDPPAPAVVTDGCILRVLDGLLVLDGERLSYRTLDVAQIGSVYETVMGFTVLTLPGPALAIKAGKRDRTPVFVDLDALLAAKPGDRAKHLKEQAERGKLAARVGAALAAAGSGAALIEALRPIVDERGSPGGRIAPPGTPLLQPTDERRRTGSHYTPRTLTEPIVRHALAPAFERIGPDATPDAVLGLKVCDPAMGSGAFLVEACRQLAARLVAAWSRHPGTRPDVPLDEDEDLLARRLVAQRCLYGVDRNPMATDLARLSLWLATLARDHEFTFLDHALRTGDSLVGLTRPQVEALDWRSAGQLSLFGSLIPGRLDAATAARVAIRGAAEDVALHEQERLFRGAEQHMAELRIAADGVLGAFFGADRPRARMAALEALHDTAGSTDRLWAALRVSAAGLQVPPHRLRPFHWPLEFPEVFAGDTPGFDAIVGNPPFAGKNTLLHGNRLHYLDWLQTLHADAHGNADLVAHFFRRAFLLLRLGGCLGLIATNTIGQGDTRESGLRWVLANGGTVVRARRRYAWPGEAAVVVSIVHIIRGPARSPVLDGRQVRRISAYLVEGDLDDSPAPLAANAGKAFQGCILLGMGFTFDDEAAAKGKASPLSEMHRLIAKEPRNAERIFPYLGGEEVNNDPRHTNRRWCIDFNNFPLGRRQTAQTWASMSISKRMQARVKMFVPLDYLEPVAEDWPDLIKILEYWIKNNNTITNMDSETRFWWQFLRSRPELRFATKNLSLIISTLRVKRHNVFFSLEKNIVLANTLYAFSFSKQSYFAVLQSSIHELWVHNFSSTMKDDINYSSSDCFENFPFPLNIESLSDLENLAVEYQKTRLLIMAGRNEGLTKIYNRYHDHQDRVPETYLLRKLHNALDVTVLQAYGWNDLADTAAPDFLSENTEPNHCYQDRLFWPEPFRDKVLARLLALNAERAAEERALGLSPRHAATDDVTETEAA